ncbi:MAG TPA: MFS transporter [Pirellulales bacterium]|nr:MFS transporter [Pirellulales bacterium]
MGSIRARLSVMMFLQYFVWGSWGVEIGRYMTGELGFTGVQLGFVGTSTAIATMVSPWFMGYVADRFFSTEKILALLHLIGAVLLGCAASTKYLLATWPDAQNQFNILYPVMIAYALVFMPTLALTNSISFENIKDPEKEFPIIRVFGTLGWIAAGLFVGFILKATPESMLYPYITAVVSADGVFFRANNFIVMAAGSSALLGLYCLTLPYTPPKRTDPVARQGDRKSILGLLADRSFLVFTIASFLICIPLAFYYNLANVFLDETDAPWPTALQTIGQMSEVFFMAAMPFFIAKMGVKRMLTVGMLAWVLRYACFGSLNFSLTVIGLLLHGVCYDFFFVASQIYVDGKVDASQRARAQGFLAVVTLGLGMFVGGILAGYTRDLYPPIRAATVDPTGEPIVDKDGKPVLAGLPNWDPTGESGFAKDLGLTKNDTLDLDQFPKKYTDSNTHITYLRNDLALTLMRAGADADHDQRFSRPEWRKAQESDWHHIWLWPGVGAGLTLVFFWLGFRDKVSPSQLNHMVRETPLGAGEGSEPQVG